MSEKALVDSFRLNAEPNYVAHGNECTVFRSAFSKRIPLLLKGPTGCGKTRFIEYMSYSLGLPLFTVSCHEDLTASDLIGRFLLKDEETVWEDGPLTLAVRHGGICYLDEIVEARRDTVVVIHSLTDDRRMLFIDKTREVVKAADDFLLVMSYNPGYQNVMKELKESTKQRFISLSFDHPPADVEEDILTSESAVSKEDARSLAGIGEKVRNLKGFGLSEGVSTRLLVYTARLMGTGLSGYQACTTAITDTLSDDFQMRESIDEVVKLYFPAERDTEDGQNEK